MDFIKPFQFLENIRIPAFIASLEGKICLWNHAAEELSGIKREAIIDKFITQLPESPLGIEFIECIKQTNKNGRYQANFLIDKGFGNSNFIRLETCLTPSNGDQDKAIIGFFLVDETSTKPVDTPPNQRANDEEVHVVLARGAGHDFNNIFTALSANIQLLLSSELPDDLHEIILNLQKSINSGINLANSLLSINRGTNPRICPITFDKLIDRLRTTLNREFSVQLNCDSVSEPEHKHIKVDQDQIQEMVRIICDFLSRATDGKGVIELFFDITGEFRALETGAGAESTLFIISIHSKYLSLHKTHVQNLFQPYYSTKILKKTTGLGLAQAKTIAESHNGFIIAESSRHSGTEFHIHLPAPKPETYLTYNETTPKPQKTVQTKPETEYKLLVIDDDEMVRQVINTVLKPHGFSIIEAENGSETIEILKDQTITFDLILLDIQLPDIDGLKLLDKIQKLQPQTPVLLLSGNKLENDDSFNEECMNNPGIAGYQEKPFVNEDLLLNVQCIVLSSKKNNPTQ
ncbi:MAG: response regulator [Verrucomicrobia bacterium]|nr:response regulator [Verrucomicrobiota bacterium]